MQIAQDSVSVPAEPTLVRLTRLVAGSLSWALHGAAAALCLCCGPPLLAILLYPLVLVLLASQTALTLRRHNIAGRFARAPGRPLYRGRMIYGAALTTLFYFKPLLHLIMSCAPLKRMTFRMFGYRGSLDFTCYADTWLRDIALLDFGPGTYIANRVTLGTNIVQGDQILVDGIRTGRDVLIGHLSMVGPGTQIGDRTAIGQGAAIGRRVNIGADVVINGRSSIDHGAQLQNGVVIGTAALIGKCAVIHAGIRVPAGTVIPDRSVIRTQADVRDLLQLMDRVSRAYCG